MFRRYKWSLITALGLIALTTTAADEVTPQQDAATAKTVAPASTGLQVFIDEQTGEVRAPTAAETEEMAEQFRRQFIDLSVEKPVVYHADGSISKELGSSYQMYTVARLSASGELETQCLPAEQAADFLTHDDKTKPESIVEIDGDASQ